MYHGKQRKYGLIKLDWKVAATVFAEVMLKSRRKIWQQLPSQKQIKQHFNRIITIF